MVEAVGLLAKHQELDLGVLVMEAAVKDENLP